MKIPFALPCLFSLTTLASATPAQDRTMAAEKPFRAALGIYNPVGGAIRSAMGTTLPMLSLSYDLGKTMASRPLLYSVFFDYAQLRQHGTNNSMSAFGLEGRYLSRAPVSVGRYFVGAGVGSYDIKMGSSNSKIGGKLFGGYERNDGYYGQVTYHMINKINGSDPSALALAVGRRF